MAVTYDLELNEVGVGVTTINDITTNSHVLSGLNATSDYQVRVKAIDTTAGVEVHSLWSAWTDFTTLETLLDVVAQLGAISNSQTVHSVNTFITTTTYDIELTESGQSPVVINDIATNSHELTGLTLSTDYSARVRQVKTSGGVVYQSLWSTSTDFTTLAALPEVIAQLGLISNSQTIYSVTTSVPAVPVVAQLGAISKTQTIHPVITTVVSLDPIVTVLGSITNNQTVHSITTLVELPEVIAQLGSIAKTQTVHAITTSVPVPQGPVDATHWIVQLIDLSDMSVMDSQILFTSNYPASGLSANVVGDNKYRLSVIGLSDLGGKSAPLNIDFSTIPLAVSDSATFSASSEQALDQFYIDANAIYDEYINIVKLFGSVNQAFDTITATFDSSPYALTVDDLQFTGESLAVDPVIAAPQALEFSYYDDTSGLFTIDVGSSGDRLEIS